MSLQDESFPDDEFQKELQFSVKQGRLMQFPNRRKTAAYTENQFTRENAVVLTASTITPPSTNTNTSASSGTSSSDQQNLSTESATGESSSKMNANMATSDPTGLAKVPSEESVDKVKSVEHFQNNRRLKATSYYDIHKEYTKRHYRHVESKVGQYIASIRAEEEKRRSKFARHKSMPTSLTTSAVGNGIQQPQLQQQNHHSPTDLYKLNESIVSDVDGETANSSENANVMTISGNTSSHGAGVNGANGSNSNSNSASNCGSNVTSRHESSDEALNGADFIDKMAYAQLIEDKEYLEIKIKEKSNENVRLRRNVDYMRIELSNCQDKLKRLSCNVSNNLSSRSSFMGYCTSNSHSNYGSSISVDILGRYTTPNPTTALVTRATQTEYSAIMLRTPIPSSLKPDVNSSSNVLRQRSNSNSSAQKLKGSTINCLRPKYPCNTDTGLIDLNCNDLGTAKPKSRNILTDLSPSTPSSSSSADMSPKSTPSPRPSKKTRRGNGTTVNRSIRYDPVTLLNASDESNPSIFNENYRTNRSSISVSTTKQRRQHSTSLRHRVWRLFGRCTSCTDPNQSFDGHHVEEVEMTQSPTRLLN